MSKAINSPTGRLLRSSRLFSLPPPLPAAPAQNSVAGQVLRSSDTATQPYPTHQAISTPASSRSRGDWGLKRPLPSRAIPENVPHLRIKAIDTLEHITDFESAADHTQSLAKWQDMTIPMSLPPTTRNTISELNNRNRPSAFSADHDNTTLQNHGSDNFNFTAERALRERTRQASQGRWKTQGPHLTTLTEEEFDRYLVNLVRNHKQEFRKFLEAVKMDKKFKDEQNRMRGQEDPATYELELQHRSRLDKYELDDWIKELRDNHNSLNSELAHYVREFFDLPAFPAPKSTDGAATTTSNSEAGPPSTHPSAGLSYLLTNAIANNHPVYGPQAEREPVQARVLRTKNGNRGRDQRADVGLGGFVTSIQPGNSTYKSAKFKDTASKTKNPLQDLDLSLVGGNKVWLQPKSAYVDETGRIRLEVGEASQTSVDIKLGNPVQEEVSPTSSFPGRQHQRLDSGFASHGTPGKPKYGLALPDEKLRQQRPPRPRAFELRNAENKSGLEQIEELAKTSRS